MLGVLPEVIAEDCGTAIQRNAGSAPLWVYSARPADRPEEPADERFAPFWPADFHLIGKDILTTHSVYWTTLLMALDLPLPRNIFAHGWWQVEGQKMSKSIGNVIDPNRLVAEFGVDPLRYFVLRQMPFGQDGDFAAAALVERLNSDLANDIGNLASRVLNLVDKDGGKFAADAKGTPRTDEVLARLRDTIPVYEERFAAFAFSTALSALWSVLGDTNKLIQDTEPWKLLKERDQAPEAGALYDAVMATAGAVLKTSAMLLWPVMPERMQRLWESLGESGSLAALRVAGAAGVMPVDAAGTVSKGHALFPRLDAAKVESFTERAARQ